MQRGVGQHDAELPVPRRHRPGDAVVRPARQQHDRAPRTGQQAAGRAGQRGLVRRVDDAQRARRGEISDHDRERLVLAVLARPQRRGGRLAARCGRQVIAADALDRDDLPGPQQRGCLGHRVARQLGPGLVGQPQPRPAVRTADRLGMEPAVGGVVVFRRAGGAHGEPGHRGQRPVVGHAAHDREPRSAVRAVDERVAEPPVGRVGQLGQAVGARRGVRRDQGAPSAVALAGRYGEAGQPAGPDAPDRDPVDPGQWRRLALKPVKERGHRRGRSFHLGEHAVDVVADVAGQAQAGGERVDEGAEAHPLDDALHPHRGPDPAGRLWRAHRLIIRTLSSSMAIS